MPLLRILSFFFAALTLGLSIYPWSAQADSWRNLFVATVPVPFEHPPDLGFTIDRIAFADYQGECSGEFVALLTEDFLHNQVEIIEREQIERIMAEIDFSASGYIQPEDIQPLGEFMGVGALVFVQVQRCTTHQNRTHKTRETKKGNSTTYYSTTTAHFKGSIRVVDTLTGRVHSAKVVEETQEDTNRSSDGYPEYPDPYALKDAAIRAGVEKVHRMLLPWQEVREMRFFKDDDCEMEAAYRLVEIQDYDGALEQAQASLTACQNRSKSKPKLLAKAHYNLGMVHLLRQEPEQAMTYFRKAYSTHSGNRMQEGVTEAQRAIGLAEEMEIFLAANADRRAGQGVPASTITPANQAMDEQPQADDRPAAERLQELETLRDQGLITDAEFQEMRQEILSTI